MFVPRGTNISYTQERGGSNIFETKGGGRQTFFVGGGGRYDDFDEEIDVSKASFLVSIVNIFVSEALLARALKF